MVWGPETTFGRIYPFGLPVINFREWGVGGVGGGVGGGGYKTGEGGKLSFTSTIRVGGGIGFSHVGTERWGQKMLGVVLMQDI